MEKNGTFASPAIALASSVLPVPGDPISSTPLGMRPPSFWNFCGSRRNSIISCNSSLASSTPATSLNVTFFCCEECSRARALPEAQRLVSARLHLAHHENPEPQQQHERNRVHQDRNPVAAVVLFHFERHVLVQQQRREIVVVGRNDRMELVAVLHLPVDVAGGAVEAMTLSTLPSFTSCTSSENCGVCPVRLAALERRAQTSTTRHRDDQPQDCVSNT